MRFQPLGSGSRGNASLIEIGGIRLLIDAGLSSRQLDLRLEAIGVRGAEIDCILISHEHQDHMRGAELFSRRHGVSVACSGETLEAMDRSPADFAKWLPMPASQTLELGQVTVETFPVPHDAARPVGFLIRGEGLRIGAATDLGHASTLIIERLKGCDLIFIEANYDEDMLRDGPYPWHLKQRVSGRRGHLSNHETAALLGRTVNGDCRAVILGHLSEKNNTAALARQTVSRAIQAAGGKRVEIRVAAARRPTPAVEL